MCSGNSIGHSYIFDWRAIFSFSSDEYQEKGMDVRAKFIQGHVRKGMNGYAVKY